MQRSMSRILLCNVVCGLMMMVHDDVVARVRLTTSTHDSRPSGHVSVLFIEWIYPRTSTRSRVDVVIRLLVVQGTQCCNEVEPIYKSTIAMKSICVDLQPRVNPL
jgi:hypothetical protein